MDPDKEPAKPMVVREVALTHEERALLYIMGNTKLLAKTLLVLRRGAELFPRRNMPYLSTMFSMFLAAVHRYKKAHGELGCDKYAFSADVLAAIDNNKDLMPEHKARTHAVLDAYISLAEIPDYDEGRRMLKKLVEGYSQRQISSALSSSSAFEALRGLVDRGTDMVATIDHDETSEDRDIDKGINLIAAIPELMQKRTLLPFGLSYFDNATCGGVCTKELALIGAGTGGGKTMCATDVACAQARLGNLTMWFTYEQPFTNDISERIMANFTGLNLTDIRNKVFSELPPEQQQLFWASTSGIDNLVGVDFSTDKMFDPEDPDDYGGVHSIEKKIKKTEQETGKKVRFVILDWFGQIISNLAAVQEIDLSTQYRHFARKFIADLRDMMDRLDVFILLFHQLNQKACDARPTYVPNKTDFQDLRSIGNNMEWVFTIGRLDDSNIAWFNAAKARRCMPTLQTIRLDGDHARFIKEDGWSPGRDGNFFNYMKLAEEASGRKAEATYDARANDILRAYMSD